MDKPKDPHQNAEAEKSDSSFVPDEQALQPENKDAAFEPQREGKPESEASVSGLPAEPGELSPGAGEKPSPALAPAQIGPPLATISTGQSEEKKGTVAAAYEHPWVIRFCHWLNAVSLFIMIATGLRIFKAFPSFGPKIPQNTLVNIPAALTLGGWLGGALRWHFTFMWIFVGTGILYLAYQVLSGHYQTVLFVPKDIPGVWPMARHYFLFGPKPPETGQYNPLQKLAYTSTVLFGVVSLLSGIVLYKPTQFSWLAWLMGGFHFARVWHFAAMCGFLAFIPGHLIMVVLHGWNNFYSMLIGWKKNPGYVAP